MSEVHIHTFQEQVIPPTCTEPGYTLYRCDCGYEHKENFKPVVPHNFQPAETTPAACTAPGHVKYVCTTCGVTEERVLPPAGHAFGNWTVQMYPTCTEPGKQVRTCSRCGVTEEMAISPIGHKCAPGTERREDGRVVEFFCENCGQTIQCTEERKPAVAVEPKGYWSTKVVLLIGLVLALINVVCLVIGSLKDELKLSDEWLYYVIPLAAAAVSAVLLATTDAIKGRQNYARLLGIVPLLAAAAYILLTVPLVEQWTEIMDNIDMMHYYPAYTMDYILRYSVLIILQLLLAVMMFMGKKKNTWAFMLALFGVLFHLAMGMGTINQGLFYKKFYQTETENVVIWWSATLNTVPLLYWTGLAMLICPRKEE